MRKLATIALVVLAFGCRLEARGASSPGGLRLHSAEIDGCAVMEGVLAVPEDRERPGGRRIDLHVVVVPALEPRAASVPLTFLDGGPGIGATSWTIDFFDSLSALRAHRDVVLVDQRGTGGSHPLHAPGLESRSRLDTMYPLDIVEAERDRLQRDSDLRCYTTSAAVRDLDEVRSALGIERLDLMALSYGTQVAQVYLRNYPGRVRCAILIGTAPLDAKIPLHHARAAQDVLEKLFEECESDPDCAAAFPSLEREWSELLARLDAGPLEVVHTSAGSGDTSRVTLTRGPFADAVRSLMYVASDQRQLPFLIHRAAQDDFAPLLDLLLPGGGESWIAEGTYLSITCAEQTRFIEPGEIEPATRGTFLGDYRIAEQLRATSAWPLAEVPASFREPVSSRVPALLITGGMDPVTPVRWAESVAEGFPNGRVIVVPAMGHNPWGVSRMDCLVDLMAEFLDRGSARDLDTACLASILPDPFRR
jgi:pimeloyl-ACP methyl ester carboxylesterase